MRYSLLQLLATWWFGFVAVALLLQLQVATLALVVSDEGSDLAAMVDLPAEEESERDETEDDKLEKELDDLFHQSFAIAVLNSSSFAHALYKATNWSAPCQKIPQLPPEQVLCMG